MRLASISPPRYWFIWATLYGVPTYGLEQDWLNVWWVLREYNVCGYRP